MSPQSGIVDILRKAYQIEVDGYTFYSMTAERADKPAVQELFAKLASDEVQHQAFLRDVMRGYDEHGTAAFAMERRAPDLATFARKVFSDDFRKQAEGAAFETAVLSIGMQLETRAVGFFTTAASNADDEEVREFYLFLADWEKQHLNALQALYGSVRSDFWASAGFAPF